MKTTLEISDTLLARAKRLAKRTGRPLRAVVEDGLRRVLAETKQGGFRLEDRSVGVRGAPNPLELLSWHELRDEIYGGR